MSTAFSGAWQRCGLALDDAPPAEDSCVVWLQAGPFFADLRTPLAGGSAVATAFSGRTTWAAPVVTFHRDVDLAIPPRTDSGRLRFAGDRLIEDGTVAWEGRTVRYTEYWARAGRPPARRLVLEALPGQRSSRVGRRRYVEVDGQALLIVDDRATDGRFIAAHFVNDDGHWRCTRCLDGEAPATPPFGDVTASSVLSFPQPPPWSDTSWHVRWLDLPSPAEGAGHA
ncbi:hypothetical protein [Reyranella sp. CPCC 100927]|uniref:hypothetical protein n=1 Tax=Reyranella sp. CPCC 100927 TaxID=2599616 RepID=UPI0011B57133|nr:hypothetical protein [Reyranella sp. CPCC 100927]TWT14019.1 hypothetical protein FQU96_08975 [Reyranella sp. CPCC 100927]